MPALAQPNAAQPSASSAPAANTQAIPKQILKTGVNLTASGLSVNTMQLANTIGFTPLIEKIQSLKAQIASAGGAQTLETLAARQDLYDARQQGFLMIQKTMLDVDFTIAEINAEKNVYNEILTTYTNDRDKAVARTNAISFISNGALWAVCEALAIPSYKNAKFAIPSGIIGIPAGVVPSIASMYTFKQINGKKTTSEVEPNMLAKLFNYPTTADIDYPSSVWQFLNQAPADSPSSKTRKEQLVDRWISESNIPDFTDSSSKQQLDVITASVAQRKGLSISTLTTRQVMLEQLSAEIVKMKRMLLELAMALQGEKQFVAYDPNSLPRIGSNQGPTAISRAESPIKELRRRNATMEPTELAMTGVDRIVDSVQSQASGPAPQGVP
jgi:hypothetical protein